MQQTRIKSVYCAADIVLSVTLGHVSQHIIEVDQQTKISLFFF